LDFGSTARSGHTRGLRPHQTHAPPSRQDRLVELDLGVFPNQHINPQILILVRGSYYLFFGVELHIFMQAVDQSNIKNQIV
jgi:hypothetical protein